ncbi:unnamed protein product, partial [Polarella glacialis]
MAAFKMLLKNIHVPELALSVSLAEWWMGHQHRAELASVTYRPGSHAGTSLRRSPAEAAEATAQLRQCRNSEASAAVARSRLEDVQEAEQAAAEALKELQVRQRQLLGLLQSLESAREQMAAQIRSLGASID